MREGGNNELDVEYRLWQQVQTNAIADKQLISKLSLNSSFGLGCGRDTVRLGKGSNCDGFSSIACGSKYCFLMIGLIYGRSLLQWEDLGCSIAILFDCC